MTLVPFAGMGVFLFAVIGGLENPDIFIGWNGEVESMEKIKITLKDG